MADRAISNAVSRFKRAERNLKTDLRTVKRLLPIAVANGFSISPPPSIEASQASIPDQDAPLPHAGGGGPGRDPLTSVSSMHTVWSQDQGQQVVMTPDPIAAQTSPRETLPTVDEEILLNISRESNVSRVSNISATSHGSQREVLLPLPKGANDPFFVMGELKTLEQGFAAFLQASEAVIDLLPEEDPTCARTEEKEGHYRDLFRCLKPVVMDHIKSLSTAQHLPLPGTPTCWGGPSVVAPLVTSTPSTSSEPVSPGQQDQGDGTEQTTGSPHLQHTIRPRIEITAFRVIQNASAL